MAVSKTAESISARLKKRKDVDDLKFPFLNTTNESEAVADDADYGDHSHNGYTNDCDVSTDGFGSVDIHVNNATLAIFYDKL